MIRRLLQTALLRWLARHPVLVAVLLAVYVLSPLDVLPEAFTGPIGYLDDVLLLLAGFTLRELFRRRRRQGEIGSPPRDAVDTTAEIDPK
jgi:uncharacterized membrane protein YkvA (DUF1232 family)